MSFAFGNSLQGFFLPETQSQIPSLSLYFALLVLMLCQATRKLENIYLSSYQASLAGKILSDPKVNY